MENLLRKCWFWPDFPIIIVKYAQYSPQIMKKSVSKQPSLVTVSILGQPPSPHFSQEGEIFAQVFGFTGDFLDEWNNSVYCRVQKISCRFKEQARIRHSCEKCGLNPCH